MNTKFQNALLVIGAIGLFLSASASSPAAPREKIRDSDYSVTFYENGAKELAHGHGGKWIGMNVAPDGRSATPNNEFAKYDLQDKITTVVYKLPVGTAVELFTGRFWTNRSAHFPEPHGPGPIFLVGTGETEVIDLNNVQYSHIVRPNLASEDRTETTHSYNDRIRSAKLVNIPKQSARR